MFSIKKIYAPLFSSDSRYYIVGGGRGSGKSYSVNTFLLLLTYQPNEIILFTRYTLTSASISIIPEFIDKIKTAGLERDFKITKDEIINLTTGSKIIFKGIKTSSGTQTASLKSISGVSCFVLDEAEELTIEETFDKIDLSIRVSDKQNRVILILNPSTKEHWIYKKFFENNGVDGGSNTTKEDTTYIHTNYLHNLKNLSESFVKQLEDMKKSNPKKFEHIVMGGWLERAEGVIFTNWKLGDFDDSLEWGAGLDFGFSLDETALVRVAIDKKLKKIYLKEELYKSHLTTSEIYNHIKNIVANKEIIADSSEPRLIEELKRLGLNIKACKKGAGSVAEGITIMQDYELIIDPDSTNIVKELNNYVWNNKKAGQPIDMYNHSIDAARYRISHILKGGNRGSLKIR
jgi:phage terminase large subunit